jgi:signal transduction histidine kinase
MSEPCEPDAAAIRERLHDGLCQQLTGALMFSRVLADALANRNDPLAKDSETLFRMLNEAADDVHALMRSLDPGKPKS